MGPLTSSSSAASSSQMINTAEIAKNPILKYSLKAFKEHPDKFNLLSDNQKMALSWNSNKEFFEAFEKIHTDVLVAFKVKDLFRAF